MAFIVFFFFISLHSLNYITADGPLCDARTAAAATANAARIQNDLSRCVLTIIRYIYSDVMANPNVEGQAVATDFGQYCSSLSRSTNFIFFRWP